MSSVQNLIEEANAARDELATQLNAMPYWHEDRTHPGVSTLGRRSALASAALKYAHSEAKLMLAARLEQTSIQAKERPC